MWLHMLTTGINTGRAFVHRSFCITLCILTKLTSRIAMGWTEIISVLSAEVWLATGRKVLSAAFGKLCSCRLGANLRVWSCCFILKMDLETHQMCANILWGIVSADCESFISRCTSQHFILSILNVDVTKSRYNMTSFTWCMFSYSTYTLYTLCIPINHGIYKYSISL